MWKHQACSRVSVSEQNYPGIFDKARTSAADSPSFTFWALLGRSPPKLPLSHQRGKKTWLQRYSSMIIMEILRLNCWIAIVNCWEINHLLNDSLPSNLDVRQSSKSLTKQAPCARQGVRGHWPISVDQKAAPSPQESEIRRTHQSGRNPTGVKTNSSSRYISCFIKALWHPPWPIR